MPSTIRAANHTPISAILPVLYDALIMMKITWIYTPCLSLLLTTLLILSGIHQTQASEKKNIVAAIPAAVEKTLRRIIPGRQVDSVSPTVIPGMYEVAFGADIFYLSADGKHLLQGDLYDLDSQTNLTEGKRSNGRIKVIAGIDPATMIAFKPKETRHVVTVFTDIDCGYCRKLHREIDSYLARGIEIRYLAYPRSGKNTPSYFKAVSAWCADDRQQALTIAKSGVETENKSCEHPVDQHMAAANQLGITGTPTLTFADGSMIPGYMPADRLELYLNSQQAPLAGAQEDH